MIFVIKLRCKDRPIFEYCSPITNNTPSTTLQLLEKIQNRAAKLFPSLAHKLDSLTLRRNIAGLSQLYRIVNGTAPQMLLNSICPKPLRSVRTTRQGEASLGALRLPRSRTDFHQKSFLPYYINLWNSLPDSTLFCGSLDAFKRAAASVLRRRS